MAKTAKSFFCILLSIWLLSNQLCIVWLSIGLNIHKINFPAGFTSRKSLIKISDEDLRSDKTFKWIKTNKEFLKNGIMYDVKLNETVNGKLVYHCKIDHKEKELVENLNKEVTQQTHQSKSRNFKLAQILESVQLFHHELQKPCFFKVKILQTNNFCYQYNLTEYCTNTTTPPPRI
jgi:hypothetical protein